eukprot:3777044-Ditylum_brightwellii.AAC.1
MQLNKGTCYKNCVPGNSPEYNALDSNINRDIHCIVLEHVSHTALLPHTNKQKFSDSTVKIQDSAYIWLWGIELKPTHDWEAGVPNSKQTLQDMTRIVNYSILKQYLVRGVVIHSCGTHMGHRDKGNITVEKRGGQRSRKCCSPLFSHDDALSALNESLASIKTKWSGADLIDEKWLHF